jgi:hypothetical protein
MKIAARDFICVVVTIIFIYALVTVLLLIGPGNCYDNPQVCGVNTTEGGK